MAKKRKPESDPFAVLAREWTNDREKLRRVREWAERVAKRKGSLWAAVEASLAKEVLVILNGTDKKGKL